jgi:hypothetical protein
MGDIKKILFIARTKPEQINCIEKTHLTPGRSFGYHKRDCQKVGDTI